MLFFIIGLGILVACMASWASLLADGDFSQAILQDGILTFWWNSLIVLLEQPEFLVSTPYIAVPLLVAAVGPFIGIPITIAGILALWRRPKEIEVQAHAIRMAHAAMMNKQKEKTENNAEIKNRSKVINDSLEIKKNSFGKIPENNISILKNTDAWKNILLQRMTAVTKRKIPIAAMISGIFSGFFTHLSQQKSKIAKQTSTGQQEMLKAQKREEERKETIKNPKEIVEKTIEKENQPLPERIMEWYAAWVTVRAGQRPPKMLEEAKRLATELDAQTRLAMTSFGLRGATALSMLESAAAIGTRQVSSEEEDILPSVSLKHSGPIITDPDEFSREVEAPTFDGSNTQGGMEVSGPVFIEDDTDSQRLTTTKDIANRDQDRVSGPVVIEDDIGYPIIQNMPERATVEKTKGAVVKGYGREEIEISIEEESEFLPAPGTVDPNGSAVATTGISGWDEVSISEAPVLETTEPTAETTGNIDQTENLVEEAETEAFLKAAAAAEKSMMDLQEVDKQIENERIEQNLSPPQEALQEVVQKQTEDDTMEEKSSLETSSIEEGGGEKVNNMNLSPQHLEDQGEEWKETFLEEKEAEGKADETVPDFEFLKQKEVISRLLADQNRRATILGEKEGTPSWTLRRLELYGLLGLSNKSNPAVVRMWEALDRLVEHQAKVFAWENLKESPPAGFETQEQRAQYVVRLAHEVVAERNRISQEILEEIRRLKEGTEHVAWMDDRVDAVLAAMSSPKVMEQLSAFFPKPEETKVMAGDHLLKVMTGHKEPGNKEQESISILETPYEDLLAASHDIHQRYKEFCKGLMIPIYRSLSVKIKEENGRPAYAQIELVIGDVASVKQRSSSPEGAIGIIFVLVPSGRWRIVEAEGRAGSDKLILEGLAENTGRWVRVRDRSLEIFSRWVEGRNMRPYGVVHLLPEEGTVIDGIDHKWGNIEFVRHPWGQKDLEALQKNRLRPRSS